MGHLYLSLLGTPRVRHGDMPLAFPTRKALALLVYLAVEGGLHSREKLAALFWPDSDQQHGRAMLRYTLTSLRRALSEPAGASHLVVEHDALAVDPAEMELDLHQIRTASRTPLAATAEAGSSAAFHPFLAHPRNAAELWRGEFLDGFALADAPDFDAWAGLQRERCRQDMERLLDRLSQAQADRGVLTDAIETTTRGSPSVPSTKKLTDA